jgi:hypothetical protein
MNMKVKHYHRTAIGCRMLPSRGSKLYWGAAAAPPPRPGPRGRAAVRAGNFEFKRAIMKSKFPQMSR